MYKITKSEINTSNLINNSAKSWAIDNLEYLNKPMKFFGSSMKTEKGSDKFETYILYLQPADKVAIKTLCVFAEKAGCKKDCLISSGMLGMTTGQNAATKRTVLMLLRPIEFRTSLLSEIDKAERKALKTGIPALFRLNGTSDIDFNDVIKMRPNSQFYDYTKITSRIRKNKLANYDLTFSGSMFSSQSKLQLKKAIKRNYRVAMAFNTAKTKFDTLTMPNLTSFDGTDLRHLDKNVIGTLTRKGSSRVERAIENKKTNSFFVTLANITEFNDILAK